jgi:hypothetical protein
MEKRFGLVWFHGLNGLSPNREQTDLNTYRTSFSSEDEDEMKMSIKFFTQNDVVLTYD